MVFLALTPPQVWHLSQNFGFFMKASLTISLLKNVALNPFIYGHYVLCEESLPLGETPYCDQWGSSSSTGRHEIPFYCISELNYIDWKFYFNNWYTSFSQNWQPWSISHEYFIFWSFEKSTPSIVVTVACATSGEGAALSSCMIIIRNALPV